MPKTNPFKNNIKPDITIAIVGVVVTSLINVINVNLNPDSTKAEDKTEVIKIDSNCQHNQQSNEFTIFYQSEFKTEGQTYWFYSGSNHTDEAAISCISKPGFKQARLLKQKLLQNAYIQKIVKRPIDENIFIIDTIDGNGSGASTYQYELTFSTPDKPTLTKLYTCRSER